MKDSKYEISDELLTAYTEGTTTPEETMRVVEALKHDESLRETLFIISSLDALEESTGQELPMVSMAAASEENLCDIACERRILKDYFKSDDEDLQQTAEQNRWLKDEGMPLHHMGRLLERKGLTVTRKYDCTFDDIKFNVEHRVKMIAVISAGDQMHAVVPLSLTGGLIKIYDPARNRDVDWLAEEFEEAWSASRHYLVSAAIDKLVYDPKPIDLTDVLLDDDLLDLTEAIAENTHEVWAFERRKEGWSYGPQRNDVLKHNPDMVPYSDLPESEKEYDRKIAFDALRLAKKLGFNLSRSPKHKCPHCGSSISPNMKFCPHCGEKLSWKVFQ
ncbi:MAG: zinc-ribbon domain-containing protein [Bacteroidales bacterium]|nr:zinc-ribbon domain-containing protein [Bacteroidales bacterium]